MPRSTLSCCIVVKNEEKTIRECLDNIGILADEIVIVDTGSTDHTCDIVTWWTKQKHAEKNVKLIKVGNRFHDADGDFDFGAAKTFAFSNATRDFVMWLDASDVVIDQKKVKREFLTETAKNAESYFELPTALSKRFAFNRKRIAPRKYALMKGRIHETLTFRTKDKDGKIIVPNLNRVVIPVPIKNFKQSRNLERNLRILMKEWQKEKTPRTCFYIANSYREMLKPKEAIEWYKRRVYEFPLKNDFKEEHFKSLECIAELILEHSHEKFVNIMDLFDIGTEMVSKESNRFEGYFYMGKYYMLKEEWEKALVELRKYKNCIKPKKYKLWVNGTIYTGKAIARSIEQCKTALKYKEVLKPDEIIDYNQPKSTYKRGNQQYMTTDTIK